MRTKTRRIRNVILAMEICCAGMAAQAQSTVADVAESPEKKTHIVYISSSTPVGELAKTLGQQARRMGLEIAVVADPLGNSLIISADQSDQQQVARLLKVIDRPQHQLSFDVVMVTLGDKADPDLPTEPTRAPNPEQILKWEAAGQCESVYRVHLTTLENQSAEMQIGGRSAVTVNRSNRDPRTGSGLQKTFVNYGTLLKVTGRVGGDGKVRAQLSLERSIIDQDVVGTASDSPPPIAVTMVNSSLQLEEGQYVTVGGMNSTTNGQREQLYVLVRVQTRD